MAIISNCALALEHLDVELVDVILASLVGQLDGSQTSQTSGASAPSLRMCLHDLRCAQESAVAQLLVNTLKSSQSENFTAAAEKLSSVTHGMSFRARQPTPSLNQSFTFNSVVFGMHQFCDDIEKLVLKMREAIVAEIAAT